MTAGRPKKAINIATFESLCKYQCTREEICDILGVSDKTLNNFCNEKYGENFSVVYRQKSADGKMSIRRQQFKLAEKNAALSIWLGKQYLGQKEPETEKEKAQTELIKAQTEVLRNGNGKELIQVQIVEDIENDS